MTMIIILISISHNKIIIIIIIIGFSQYVLELMCSVKTLMFLIKFWQTKAYCSIWRKSFSKNINVGCSLCSMNAALIGQ